MGWASDAFHRDIMDAGYSSGLIQSGGLKVYSGCSGSGSSSYIPNDDESPFDSDKFIKEMEELEKEQEETVEETKEFKAEEKVDNTIKINARLIFEPRKNNERGTYNINIGGFIEIKGISLYVSESTGVYWLKFPSKKTGSNNWFSYVECKSQNLYSSMIGACVKEYENYKNNGGK